MATPQDQLERRKTIYDLAFLSWLQKKGLIDIVVPPAEEGGENVSIDLEQEMKNDFLNFIKSKGFSILNEPLPTKEEAAARLAQSTAELRQIYLQRSGATIGPIAKEKVEAAPIISPGQKASFQGQPTLGAPRREKPPLSAVELQGQKKAEATKIVFWKEIGRGFDEVLSGDGTGWLRILRAGPEDSKRFFSQVIDILGLVKQGKTKEAAGYLADATANGLTLGIINPKVLDKIDNLFVKNGITSDEYTTMAQRREGTLRALGYYPQRPAAVISGVAMVPAIGRIAKYAKMLGVSATTVPVLQRIITAVAGGTATGAAQVAGEKIAGEPFKVQDVEKIPTHMLWWGLFELGSLGMETAAKIVNWNLKYGGKLYGTGKYGGYGAAQGVEFETIYEPGAGPTTRTNFTGEEVRSIYREVEQAASQTASREAAAFGGSEAETISRANDLLNELNQLLSTDPAAFARRTGMESWKVVDVFDALKRTGGWQEALRRGWIPIRPIEVPGPPPRVAGVRIKTTGPVRPHRVVQETTEEIPMKPDWGQIFRKGGALRQWPAEGITTGNIYENIRVQPAAPGGAIPPGAAPPGVQAPPRPATGQPGPSQAPPGGPPPAGSAPPARITPEPARGRAQQPPPQPPPLQQAPPAAAAPGEKPPIVPPIETRKPTFEDSVYLNGKKYGDIAGLGTTTFKIRRPDGSLDYMDYDSFNKGPYSLDPDKKVGIENPQVVDKKKYEDETGDVEGEKAEEAGGVSQELDEDQLAGARFKIADVLGDDGLVDQLVEVAVKAGAVNKILWFRWKGKLLGENLFQPDIKALSDYIKARNAGIEKRPINDFKRGKTEAKRTKPGQAPRTDTELREAIDRIKAGDGTPEDLNVLASAPRTERYNQLLRELKPEIDKIRAREAIAEAEKKTKRGATQIQQEMVKLRQTIEDLREQGDPQGLVPNLEAQRRALNKEWEAAKKAEKASATTSKMGHRPRLSEIPPMGEEIDMGEVEARLRKANNGELPDVYREFSAAEADAEYLPGLTNRQKLENVLVRDGRYRFDDAKRIVDKMIEFEISISKGMHKDALDTIREMDSLSWQRFNSLTPEEQTLIDKGIADGVIKKRPRGEFTEYARGPGFSGWLDQQRSAEGIPKVRAKESAGKNAWEMTFAEFTESARGKRPAGELVRDSTLKEAHRTHVQTALAQGKPVPDAVMKDYPELEVYRTRPRPQSAAAKKRMEQRRAKAAETPEEHVRRIMKSRREAQAKRGKVGVPKDAPEIVKDILKMTSGIKPILDRNGKVSAEYDLIPKYLKNKNGMGIDDLETRLAEMGYPYGPGSTKRLLDDLEKLNFKAQAGRAKTGERTAEDYEAQAEEAERQAKERAATAEAVGLKTKEETYEDFLERMAIEADESGMGEDEAWKWVEAKIQAQKAYQEKYGPIMKEGESWPGFLERMEKEAVDDGMFPEDSLVYADRLLKKKTGSSEPPRGERLFISPKIQGTGAAKGRAWFSGAKDSKGRAIVVLDPEPKLRVSTGAGDPSDVYSNVVGQMDYDEKNVLDMPEWRITLDHWVRGDDPKFNEFLDEIKKIFMETDGYGKGPNRNIPYIPPVAMKAAIDANWKGSKGARIFQLKWILAHDFVARLFQVPAGNPPFYGANAFVMGFFPQGHPLAGRTAGAFLRPNTGELFVNINYLDVSGFTNPWSVAMHLRDVVLHEFVHYRQIQHNEVFTSRLVQLGSRVSHLTPYIVRIAEKMVGAEVFQDRRKVFIQLGPGRGQNVPSAIVQLVGNDGAKYIAETMEDKGDRKLYEPKAIVKKPGEPEPGSGAAGAGEPGAAGLPRSRRQPELAYPRSDAEARAARLEFGARPVEPWAPPVKGEPEGEFKLTPTEEKPAPLKPEELAGKQGVLPLEDVGDLFKKKPDDRFLILTKTNKSRPPRPTPRPLPPQPRIPDTGTWTAIRTDDGGLYFGEESNHYLLAQKLNIPMERIVGGGFIKEGVYYESPWSTAGRIGRDAREAMGLPRERFAITEADWKAEVLPEIRRLTSGRFFPKQWRNNTRQQIEDNQQNLARFVLENYTPEKGSLENYINANKGFFYAGERTRSGRIVKHEEQYPPTMIEAGEEQSVFGPESQPKNKPEPEPEVRGETLKKDVFGSEEIRALNAIRRGGQTYAKGAGLKGPMEDAIIEIAKQRLLNDIPESFDSLAARLRIPKTSVIRHYYGTLHEMQNDPQLIEIMKRHMKQANLGPVPSEEDLRRFAKALRKYFSSYRGADWVIDQENDRRIGRKMADVFEQTLDSATLKKWVEEQPPGTDTYLHQLMTGAISGDGYRDIQGAQVPDAIKEIMLRIRHRIDSLSELIIAHGGLTNDTIAAINRHLGQYLTKQYRLWEDKHWDPTPADRQGFKDFLMQRYGLTDPQAENFMDQELAYARNDEGLLPRKKRKTRRVPTEHYIRRKELSPEWRRFAGEIDRVPWLAIRTVTKQATMAYNAKFLDWIKDYLPDHWVSTYQEAAERGWQNSRLPEHNYAYGTLQGKWVDPELWQYIKNEFDTQRGDMEELIQSFIMNPFKWTKTIGSFPTHMRNFLGNSMFSVLARNSILNPLNLKWYKRALEIHLNRAGSARADWSDLIAKGVTETQFYGADIPRVYKEIMRFEPDQWYEKVWDRLIRYPVDKLGEIYNFEDSLYRVATYLKMRAAARDGGLGMTPEDALVEINASLQNYRKLPVLVDILRRWPILGPFISFKWNVGKIVALQAKKGAEEMASPRTRGKGVGRLMRLALMLAVPFILSEVSKVIFDVDDKKVKDLEKWYPEYRRNGSFIYFRNGEGNLKVFDFTYIWPTGDYERLGKAIVRGDVKGIGSALDFMAHPVLDIWAILFKGIDPTWGTKYRSVKERAAAAVKLLYLPASMPIPNLEGLLQGDIRPGNLTGPQVKAIIDAYNQQPDQYGRVKDLPEEVKNFFTGIRSWNVEPEALLAQAAVVRNAQIRELQSELGSWIRKNSKAPKWEIDNHVSQFKKRIDVLKQELGNIKQVRDEFARDGFLLRRE